MRLLRYRQRARHGVAVTLFGAALIVCEGCREQTAFAVLSRGMEDSSGIDAALDQSVDVEPDGPMGEDVAVEVSGETSDGDAGPSSCQKYMDDWGRARDGGTPRSWLHTCGTQILDADGNVKRITGINWFGLETTDFAPHGLWVRSLQDILEQIVFELGYNTLRIPFSSQALEPTSFARPNVVAANPELIGATALQVLDKIIEEAGRRNLRIILDHHRSQAGNNPEPLWYSATYTEGMWINDWVRLAMRYRDDPTVIGFDLHHEPGDPATWGGTGPAELDWRDAARRAGDKILLANPHLLIFVSGVEQFNGRGYWEGGNLQGVGSPLGGPIELETRNRLVYSAHDYPDTVAPGQQPWFGADTYPSNLPGIWETNWGYIVSELKAPVWMASFGTKNEDPSDKLWFPALLQYLAGKNMSFAYWSLNPNDGKMGGILEDPDGMWRTVVQHKQMILRPHLADPI